MGAFHVNFEGDDRSADLAWLAYRYVADELTAEEASTFELRLAEDQTAREAVAQAVELSSAVKVALHDSAIEPEPAVCTVEARGFWSQKTWLQPAAWMAVGAAACLAAVVCFYRTDQDESLPPVAVVEGETEFAQAGAVAMVWAQSQDSGSEDLYLFGSGDGTDGSGMDVSGMEGSADEHADANDPQMIAPGWVLAAVTRGELTDDLHLSLDDE